MNLPPTLPRFTAHDLERIIDDPKLFSMKKSDTSTTVGILKGSALGLQEDLFMKRFNYKGFFHHISKIVFGSRAKRLWSVHQRLLEKGLPVPAPLCFIEPSLKRRHSFFLCSAIDHAETLQHVYSRHKDKIPRLLSQRLGETIARFHTAGAVHGDLKWPNILVRAREGEWEFYFVDLDQAKVYHRPHIRGISKDLTRFYRSGLEFGGQEWVDSHFFPPYLAALDPETRNAIDLGRIRTRALNDWEKKGKKRF